MKFADRLLFLAGALLVAAFYLSLVWPGFSVYFTPDDTINLYKPWAFPLRELILANLVFFRAAPICRPLGGASIACWPSGLPYSPLRGFRACASCGFPGCS